AETCDVVAARHQSALPSSLPSIDLDIESASSVEAAIETARPDAVLHAAALASVDVCERDPERARRTNAGGSALLARACAARGIRIVALSTDLVFDGRD